MFEFVKKIFHEKVEEVKWRHDPVHELWSDPRMKSALMDFYKSHPEMVREAITRVEAKRAGKTK